MRIGIAAHEGVEYATYLKVRQLDVQNVYLRYNLGWSAGMLDPSWITASVATTTVVSVPMLVGPSTGTAGTDSGTGQTISPQDPSGANNPTVMTLADVAAGVWDGYWNQVCSMLHTYAPTSPRRWGWEPYGPFYPWGGPANYTAYKAAFQHLVTLDRTYSPAAEHDFNGNVAYASYDPTIGYPGDAYCDYMGTDIYDAFDPGGAAGFAAYDSAVLENALAFAKSRGKKFSIPEFGTFGVGFSNGYGDDPAWLQAIYNWMRTNSASIGYACWFNNFSGGPTTDGSGALQRNPQMASLFSSIFGGWAAQNAGEAPRLIAAGASRIRH